MCLFTEGSMFLEYAANSFKTMLFQVFFQLFCISKINLLIFILFSISNLCNWWEIGTKYDEIISEIKGDLSEEEIYTRANEVYMKTSYFCKNLVCLTKMIFSI